MSPRPLSALSTALLVTIFGCGSEVERFEKLRNEIVYGADDRLEYFEVPDQLVRARTSQSLVALVPKVWLRRTATGWVVEAPSWGEVAGLCAEEPYADQPALALCSGVLLDWDLVLTAGHCVRRLALENMLVVFGYHYTAPRQLAIGEDDVIEPTEIVNEALDPMGSQPRLDYAWLRLATAAKSPRKPAPIRVRPDAMMLGDPIISTGTVGGIPMKVDLGGTIRDVGEPWFDYFVADADTTTGSSGGAAFDRGLALAGIMVRGAQDLSTTESGCQVTVHEPRGDAAAEQFSYAPTALERLCTEDVTASSLCRRDCDDPCEALPAPESPQLVTPAGGCAVAKSPSPTTGNSCFPVLAILGFAALVARRLPFFLAMRVKR